MITTVKLRNTSCWSKDTQAVISQLSPAPLTDSTGTKGKSPGTTRLKPAMRGDLKCSESPILYNQLFLFF